jgi:hypothetical protein
MVEVYDAEAQFFLPVPDHLTQRSLILSGWVVWFS